MLLGERTYGRNGVVADHVLIDVAAARDLTAHLIGLGRTRIVVIGVDRQGSATSRQRLEGCQRRCTRPGCPSPPGSRPGSRSWTGATGCWRCATSPHCPSANGRTRSSASATCRPGAQRALHEAGAGHSRRCRRRRDRRFRGGPVPAPLLTTVVPDKAAISLTRRQVPGGPGYGPVRPRRSRCSGPAPAGGAGVHGGADAARWRPEVRRATARVKTTAPAGGGHVPPATEIHDHRF